MVYTTGPLEILGVYPFGAGRSWPTGLCPCGAFGSAGVRHSGRLGSARKLARLCQEHDGFRWLRGGNPVDYHLISDFRTEHQVASVALVLAVTHKPDALGNPERLRSVDLSTSVSNRSKTPE